MNRLIHTSLTAALSASVLGDGGVMLSGYAPPGAAEEAILGTASSAGPAHGTARSTAPSRSTMALAQPAASTATRTQATATRGRAAGGGSRTPARGAKARTRGRHATVPNTGSTASPAIVAAATRDAPGSGFGLGQGLLAAALALTTFALGRAWLRRDQ